MRTLPFILLFSCCVSWAQNHPFRVTGTLDCDYSGKIYLVYEDKVDSVQIVNRKFEFRGKLENENYEAGVWLEKRYQVDSFFLESSEITLDATCTQTQNPDYKGFWNLALKSVKGSASQDLYVKFMSDYQSYRGGKMSKEQLFSNGKKNIDDYPESAVSIYILEKLAQTFYETELTTLQELHAKIKPNNQAQVLVACAKIYDRLFPANVIAVNSKMKHFTLPDQNDKLFNTKTFSGKWILIDFWASWCTGCLEQIPNLKKLHAKDNLEIVSVSID
ncbi:AhpC/TSA family protein [Flavobacterium sp. MAH-1]|uniref:AhpC/TSA family protein n=1 Tax=Flavobacterium agri TaxID=2743471 RepID=A0A7Y8Y1K7_9FLAO|nr:TlpA disulfide reductase family protein [Flavobacterium agri]NUY80859.1 AhpC/TSA family protein [Flavobacterium agri]NYA70883.1 AhpC/TSA family protein [Flavobacterium agri]